MKLLTFVLCTSLALSMAASAQEVNDVGGSLTSHGADPGLFPFFTSAQGSMTIEIGGAPNSPFALFFGQRAAVPINIPILNGEFFEIELGPAAIPATVLFDGLAGSPFGVLDSSGSASFAFPAAAFNGLTPAFQAVVTDPTNGPLNLNLTAVGEFAVSNTSSFNGDDVIVEYHFPSGTAYELYGESFTSITVSTNGWIKMGGGCTFSDFSESSTDLFNGTIGGAPGGDPVIAAYWNDLDMGNSPNQEVRITEVQNGTGFEVRVAWLNADYFPATPLGSFDVTIKSTGVVDIDHTSVNGSFIGGIVGVSSGENAGGTTITSHDFYNGGSVPNAFFSNNFRDTLYRNYNIFNDTPSGLYRLCFRPQNAFGSYDMVGIIIGQACL